MPATSAGHRHWGHSAPQRHRFGLASRQRTLGSCTARILRITVKRPCALTPTCCFTGSVFHGGQLASTSFAAAIAASTGHGHWGKPAPGTASIGDSPLGIESWGLAQPGFYVAFCSGRVCSHRFAAGHDQQLASTPISDTIAASTGHMRWDQPAPWCGHGRGYSPGIEPFNPTVGSLHSQNPTYHH